jgi:hypothetical protein
VRASAAIPMLPADVRTLCDAIEVNFSHPGDVSTIEY